MHNPLLHTKYSQRPPDNLSRHSIKHLCQVYKKPCSLLLAARYFSSAAWLQRLRLLCLCLGQSQTWNPRLTPTVWWGSPQSSPGLPWPALSALDCFSFSFSMHPPYPCRGRQWNSAPSQRVTCHRKRLQLQGHRSWESHVSPAAHIISTTVPDGPSALLVFIWEIAFLTISLVIGIGRPSIGSSSVR